MSCVRQSTFSFLIFSSPVLGQYAGFIDKNTMDWILLMIIDPRSVFITIKMEINGDERWLLPHHPQSKWMMQRKGFRTYGCWSGTSKAMDVLCFYAGTGMRHNRISRLTANGDQTIPVGKGLLILTTWCRYSQRRRHGVWLRGYLYVSTVRSDIGRQDPAIQMAKRQMDEVESCSDNPGLRQRGQGPYVFAGFRNHFQFSHQRTGKYCQWCRWIKYRNQSIVRWFYGGKIEGKKPMKSSLLYRILSFLCTLLICCIVDSGFIPGTTTISRAIWRNMFQAYWPETLRYWRVSWIGKAISYRWWQGSN